MEFDFVLSRPDGQDLVCYRWSGNETPRGVLVVAHGMGEHANRYRPALAAVIDAGFVVYAPDHRGHGRTLSLSGGEPGDFGPGGFPGVVDDLASLARRAREEHPSIPVYLLGHSMGSFIAQSFLIDHGDRIDGAILVGTTAVDLLAEAVMRESDVMAALNRPFEPARTPCDWLSRDKGQVDAYIADPLCGFALVPDSMISMLSQGARLADTAALSRIPAGLPLRVMVGERDTLINSLGKLQPVLDRYRAVGLKPDVSIYPDARHEILNEINREEVVGDLTRWLLRQSARQTA